jgi:tetratricopeptide (TPR) repeat protein
MKKCLFPALALVFACSAPESASQEKNHELQFDSAWKSGDSIQIRQVRTALSLASGRDPYILYSRAWLLAQAGNLPKSLKTADSLVMGYPAFAKGHYLRGNLKASSGNLEGAFKDYENAIRRDPALFEAYLNRGALYFQDKHPEHAIPDFRKAIALRKSDFQAWLNLGNAFASAGSTDSACYYWSEAGKLGSAKALEIKSKFCPQP